MKAASSELTPPLSLSKSGLFSFSLTLIQLLAVILLVQLYDIESFLNLFELLVVTTGGFIIHAFLPKPLRIYFFGILSLILLSVLIGLTSMTMVLLIGSVITLISALIANRIIKYSLLSIIIAGLVYLMAVKPGWIQPHIAALSILGSMFVFRLSLYLYDTNYQREKAPLIKDWTYFFMLPNMALLLFPVVDYKLFQKKYFDEDSLKIYKKGVQWIVLGVFHLMVYRFIYYYLLLPPNEVKDAVSFWHYSITNYTLIIRLSGIFHISVGILCLFGFNLPRVFDNYFLASGFSDLWRRINIYFKDYVIRLFYYPIFFKIRKIGDLNAKVVTILFIFFMTWFLHSLQWFWLRGFFPIRMVDVVFWGVFGILVAGNAVWESKKRRVRPDKKSWGYASRMTAQIMGMFLFMSILWSIWSSTTMGDWFAVASNGLNGNLYQWAALISGLLLFWIIGSFFYRQFELKQWGKVIDPNPWSAKATFWSVSMIIILLLFQLPFVYKSIEKVSNTDLEGFLQSRLNLADEHLLVEGYYEEILIGNELTNPVGEMMRRGQGGQFRFTEAAMEVDDIRSVISRPNTYITFKDKPYSVNSIGIRDREYPIEKAKNTVRTAILGGSFPNGSGVGDDEIFDKHLEFELNNLLTNRQFEFWNFSHAGYDIIQCVYDFESKMGWQYDFDNLIYFSHGIDNFKNARLLANAFLNDTPMPFSFINEIIENSDINKGMSSLEAFMKLEPYGEEIVRNSYQRLYDLCIKNNIRPIWIYWPTIFTHPLVEVQHERLEEIASEIGFFTISLADVYHQHVPHLLIVAPNDRHPNTIGHHLVAEKLIEIFSKNPEILISK